MAGDKFMQVIPAGYQGKNRQLLNIDPQDVLDNLAMQVNGITIYNAGLPFYPFNFTRDSLLSAILMENTIMLREQLVFCSLLQGTRPDPYTGEEPGKIFHQMPGVIQNKLSTEFNASDVTALFIYGHEVYLKLTNDYQFIKRQKKYLYKAVEYILKHLVNFLFVDDPKYSGGKKFALKVTYWKDSQVPNRAEGMPVYPAVYTLSHIQNMRALRSAAKLLGSQDLFETANQMKRHMTILFDEKHGVFHSGVDQKGFFPGISSDNLHMLYYLDIGDLSDNRLLKIIENTKLLETPYGYLTMNTKDKWLSEDVTKHTGYHTNTIWPFEQAFIHIAALKFKQKSIQEIAERIYRYLDNGYPELFKIDKDNIVKHNGCDPQLWTVATKIYFDKYFNNL